MSKNQKQFGNGRSSDAQSRILLRNWSPQTFAPRLRGMDTKQVWPDSDVRGQQRRRREWGEWWTRSQPPPNRRAMSEGIWRDILSAIRPWTIQDSISSMACWYSRSKLAHPKHLAVRWARVSIHVENESRMPRLFHRVTMYPASSLLISVGAPQLFARLWCSKIRT